MRNTIKYIQSRLTSWQWVDHFHQNATQLLPIPWDRGVKLSEAERRIVTRSMQEFQLGESSEGRGLLARAARYARRSGDRGYLVALGLFIGEEHRHAQCLGRVMELAGIPCAKRTLADSIFRRLRKFGGIESAIVVLVTAEIVATVYYAALRSATGSIVIQWLCDQILADEDWHVRFQCERLSILRQGRPGWGLALRRGMHRSFMLGVSLVVWCKHRRVLQAGGYGLWRFMSSMQSRLTHALMMADPRSYSPAASACIPLRSAGQALLHELLS